MHCTTPNALHTRYTGCKCQMLQLKFPRYLGGGDGCVFSNPPLSWRQITMECFFRQLIFDNMVFLRGIKLLSDRPARWPDCIFHRDHLLHDKTTYLLISTLTRATIYQGKRATLFNIRNCIQSKVVNLLRERVSSFKMVRTGQKLTTWYFLRKLLVCSKIFLIANG